MSNQLNLDTDVKTLTQNQLEELRQLCWDKDSEISTEVNRRASLPFIWESELASVQMIRTVMQNEPKPFSEWKRPTNIVDSYIIGDSVTHNGKKYLAQGRGALMYAPDEVDPLQGVVWIEQPEERDGDPADDDSIEAEDVYKIEGSDGAEDRDGNA